MFGTAGFLAFVIVVQQPESRVAVRSDDGRRAIFVRTYGGTPDMPRVGGHLYLAPAGTWPRRRNYDLWLVEYDCAGRNRTNNARITYSSWRDPQRVMIDPPRVGDAEHPAVEDQLALACDHDREGRATYRTLDDFLMDRPLP
jgi:hypothetical protein